MHFRWHSSITHIAGLRLMLQKHQQHSSRAVTALTAPPCRATKHYVIVSHQMPCRLHHTTGHTHTDGPGDDLPTLHLSATHAPVIKPTNPWACYAGASSNNLQLQEVHPNRCLGCNANCNALRKTSDLTNACAINLTTVLLLLLRDTLQSL